MDCVQEDNSEHVQRNTSTALQGLLPFFPEFTAEWVLARKLGRVYYLTDESSGIKGLRFTVLAQILPELTY